MAVEYDGHIENCPYCGWEAYVYAEHPLFGVGCTFCSARGRVKGMASEAVGEWNRVSASRKENERLANQNAELRMALRIAHLPLPPSAQQQERAKEYSGEQ